MRGSLTKRAFPHGSLTHPFHHGTPKPTRSRSYTNQTNSHRKPHIRLMPLGGSITYGSKSSSGNGYRKPLYDLLVADGYHIEMLGSRQAGTMSQNHNEGWRGFRIDQLESKVIKSVSTYLPDVITFNAGSNDCRQQYEIDSAGGRVRKLLERMWAVSPASTILLSTLVRSADERAERAVGRVNEQIWKISRDMAGGGRKLVVVDMHGVDGLGVGDLADGTHPNDGGYEKMGRLWYGGVKEAEEKGFLL